MIVIYNKQSPNSVLTANIHWFCSLVCRPAGGNPWWDASWSLSLERAHYYFHPFSLDQSVAKLQIRWAGMYTLSVIGGPAKSCGKAHGGRLMLHRENENLGITTALFSSGFIIPNSLPWPQDCVTHRPKQTRSHSLSSVFSQNFNGLVVHNFLFPKT